MKIRFHTFSLLLLSAVLAIGTQEIFASEATATPRLSKTVGLDIVKLTTNADSSLNLVFRWKDQGQEAERTVVVNGSTIIFSDGKLLKMADLTEKQLHKKAVATVGADNVTAVCLRFGKAPVPKDQLTPAQVAVLAVLTPPPTAASEVALEKRVTGMVASLKLNDPAKEARVHAVIATDLRAIRDAHNAGFPPDKSVHENLVAGLQADLTSDQVETVKNLLTINKVPVTFRAYHEIVPNLTAEDDQTILKLLNQAREDSLDVKNPDEMAPIFKKYKEQIQAYLNAHGHDWAKSYKAFVDAQKAGAKPSAAD